MDYREQFESLVNEQRLEEALDYLLQNQVAIHDDTFYYANMGWLLNQLERYEEAYIYLLRGHERFYDDSWLCAQLGYTSNRLNRLDEGISLLLMALAMDYDEAWVHGELGWTYHELKDYSKAISYYENALMEEPNDPWLLKQAAYSYIALGNDEDALYDLRKAHLLEPDDLEITLSLIECLGNAQAYLEQITLIETVAQSDEDGWIALQKGMAYIQLEKPSLALKQLLKAIQRGRDDTYIHQLLGDVYQMLGKPRKANQAYRQALSYFEKARHLPEGLQIDLLLDMVLLARKSKQTKLELQYLKEMEGLDNKNLFMLDGIAQYHSDHHHYRMAVSYLKRLMGQREDLEDMALLAWNLGRLHKHEEALSSLQACLTKGRADRWLMVELAWNYASLKQHDSALLYYQKALDLDPDDIWIQTQIAWNLGILHRHEEAVDIFLQCLNKEQDTSSWLYANLGWNYRCLHQYEQAIHYLTQANILGYQEAWLLQQIEEVTKLLCEKA